MRAWVLKVTSENWYSIVMVHDDVETRIDLKAGTVRSWGAHERYSDTTESIVRWLEKTSDAVEVEL